MRRKRVSDDATIKPFRAPDGTLAERWEAWKAWHRRYMAAEEAEPDRYYELLVIYKASEHVGAPFDPSEI